MHVLYYVGVCGCVSFPFGSESGVWDLIVLVSDFSLSFYFDIPCESSARQRIHMKHQVLFFSNDENKQKKIVCCNFAWLFKGYVWPLTCGCQSPQVL